MRSTFKIWSRLLLVFILCGCSGSHEQEDAVIREAAQLMQEQPDSALRVLGKVSRHSLRGETLARYALIHSIAQDKSGQDVTNDSLLRIAYGYYSRHPEDSLYARSQYYMGLYFSLVDSTKQAEDCLRTAVRYAGKRKEYYTQYLALDRLSKSFQLANPTKAIQLGKQALSVLEKHYGYMEENHVYLLIDLLVAYRNAGERDSALICARKAEEIVLRTKNKSCHSFLMQERANLYSRFSQPDSALLFAKKSYAEATRKDLSKMMQLAFCYADVDSLGTAKELFLQIVRDTASSELQKYVSYDYLSKISIRNSRDTDALCFFDSASFYIKQMYLHSLEVRSQYYDDILQLYKKEEAMRAAGRQKSWIMGSCIFLLLLIIAALYSFFYIRRKNTRREREHLERQHQMELEFEKRMAKEKLENKDRSLRLMKKYLMSKEAFPEKVKSVRHSESGVTISQKDWKEIALFLNEADNLFVERIMAAYPSLCEKDCQLLMLVRLNFSNLQLANIFHISESSMKQKLYESKSLVNLTDKNKSLRQFILDF